MTTTYYSKIAAFQTGAMYAGYSDKATIARILEESEVREGEITNPLVAMLGDDEASEDLKRRLTKKAEIRTITAADGRKIDVAVSQFRDGYDLYLINPDTGLGTRI